MTRLASAALFFVIGLGFVGALRVAPVLDCNELCPDWFTAALLAYYTLPLTWLAGGWFSAGKAHQMRLGTSLCLINLLALLGVMAGTRHYVLP